MFKRRSHIVAFIGALSALLALVGCNNEESTCTAVAKPRIKIHVRNASSLASLDGVSMVTVRRTVAPNDSAVGPPYDAARITYNVSGTYTVKVEAAGYRSQRRDVTVPGSTAHCVFIVTQDLMFEMVTGP